MYEYDRLSEELFTAANGRYRYKIISRCGAVQSDQGNLRAADLRTKCAESRCTITDPYGLQI